MVVMFSRILSPVTLVDIVTVNTADCKLEIGRQRRRERVSEFTPYSPIFSHPYVDFYFLGVFFPPVCLDRQNVWCSSGNIYQTAMCIYQEKNQGK